MQLYERILSYLNVLQYSSNFNVHRQSQFALASYVFFSNVLNYRVGFLFFCLYKPMSSVEGEAKNESWTKRIQWLPLNAKFSLKTSLLIIDRHQSGRKLSRKCTPIAFHVGFVVWASALWLPWTLFSQTGCHWRRA